MVFYLILDSLEISDLVLFCIYDKDNDNMKIINCVELLEYVSGWWYLKVVWCIDGNLNGIYKIEYVNY